MGDSQQEQDRIEQRTPPWELQKELQQKEQESAMPQWKLPKEEQMTPSQLSNEFLWPEMAKQKIERQAMCSIVLP